MIMIDVTAQEKIVSLQREIDAIYKEAKSRPSNMHCDICGAGDLIAKNGIAFKVKDVVIGYERRPSESPRLCHRHATGWTLSHNSYNLLSDKSRVEIDLHFTQYLAKQLMKAKHETYKQTQPA